jgi:hypothetical protein
MAAPGTNEGYNAKVISSTTTVNNNFGALCGIFVATTTSGTITVYDGTSTAGTIIIPTFTPAAATFYPLPANYGTGLHIVIANTISCTVFYL